jgi:hypothetical protein
MAGMSFADLVEGKRTFDVKFANGKRLEITYEVDKMTPATLRRINEAIESGDELSFARMVAGVMCDWELEGPFGEGEYFVPEGEKVPIEPEYLAYFPGPYMAHIWNSIAEDANPDPKRRARSSGR